jgi:hypothetical protein
MGLSNSRVAREWTHGRDKRGSNFYAADGTIYSYGSHFPIARFYTLADGKRVCLFTAREYSSSTARHKSYVSRAIPSAVPVFVVPAVARFGADLDKAGHRANLKAYREKIAGLVKSSRESRRRADTRLGFLRQAEAVARDATEYARAFRLGLRGAVGTGVGEAEREALRQAGEVAGAAASARRLARRAAENSRWEASRERERVENADKFAKWKAGEHNDTLGLSAFPVAFPVPSGV